MSAHIRVTAVLMGLPGKGEAIRDAMAEVAGMTRREEGCIEYEPHVCATDSNRFLFAEEWASKDHLDAHLQQPHLKAFQAKVSPLLARETEVAIWRKL